MAIELYTHNQQTYKKMTEMFRTSNRVGIVQPTGTGKSFLILKWIEDHPNNSFIILSSATEIFKQFADYAAATGDLSLLDSVQMISYQTLLRMPDEDIQDLRAHKIVVDEFHRTGAELWGPALMKLLEANPDAQVLGTSATPVRYLDDSRDMAYELFDRNLAIELTLGEAVAKGILPSPTYVPIWYDYDDRLKQYQEDIAMVTDRKERDALQHTLNQLKNNLQNAYGAEDVFATYMPNNYGKYIVFCRDYNHLQEMQVAMQQWLYRINPCLRFYVSVSREKDRDLQLEAFKMDDGYDAIKLLFTVDRLNEGLHVKGVDGVIMLRPTTSPIIYLQQMGRALVSGANSPIIFDMVNNYRNLSISSPKGESIFRDFYPTPPPDQDPPEAFSEQFNIFSQMAKFTELFAGLEYSLYLGYERRWQRNYEILSEFIKINNRFPVKNETYRDINIGNWINTQKQDFKAGQLSPEREQMLRAIGIDFDRSQEEVLEDQWQENYAILKEYVENNNQLPAYFTAYKGKNIGIWLSKQKPLYKSGSLSPKRQRLLRALGVDFERSKEDIWEEQWQRKYALLKEFIDTHSRLPIAGETYNGATVGTWLRHQKNDYNHDKLNSDHELSLRAIGVDLDRSQEDVIEEKWQSNYELVREFIAALGRTPAHKEVYKCENIGTWLNNQKTAFRKEKLSPEHAQLLRDIGIDFDRSREDVIEEKWQRNYELVKKFIAAHGRTPAQRETYNGENIGIWLNNQKTAFRKEKLSPERAQLLRVMGVEFK